MEPLRIEAGERSASEILDALEDGRRVIVETEFLDDAHEVTLRRDDSYFYCDTPTRLHKHTSRQEMETCLTNEGYSKS